MLIDPLTDADCTCLRTLAITAHRPCCATCTDYLTKVVQTLYLVYIPPMRRIVLRLPTCAFYQVSSNLDSIALTILVIVNTSLVITFLVLTSYLVYLVRHIF